MYYDDVHHQQWKVIPTLDTLCRITFDQFLDKSQRIYVKAIRI